MTTISKVVVCLGIGALLGYLGWFANAGFGWLCFLTGTLVSMWKMGLLDD